MSFLEDYFRGLVPHIPNQQDYFKSLAAALGTETPNFLAMTPRVQAPGDLAANQASGMYDQPVSSGRPGELPGLDQFSSLLKTLDPKIGTNFLLTQMAQQLDPQQQQRAQELKARGSIADLMDKQLSAPPNFAPVNISPMNDAANRNANFDVGGAVTPSAISPSMIRDLALQAYKSGGNPGDIAALLNIGKGQQFDLAKGTKRFDENGNIIASNEEPQAVALTTAEKTQLGFPEKSVVTRKPDGTFAVDFNAKSEFVNGQAVDPYNTPLGTVIQPQPDRTLTQIYDPNSPTGSTLVPRDQAQGKPGPMTANSPAPAISETSRVANAARVAAGEPLTQVFPGYRGNVMAQRDQARNDAIDKIMNDNPGMSAGEAGIELSNRIIAFQSGKRSSSQLTTMLGATKQGVGQLDFNINKAKEEMAKLPSTDLSPILNAIARGEEKWAGNPAYSSLFYYMHATAVESARILSGGQASTAQLHQGAMEEAQKWSSVNMTPASFDAVATAMKAEGQNRIQTYQDALKSQRVGGPGTAPPGTIRYDAQGRRIP